MGWIVALCLVISTSAWGHTIEGRIVGVHDGDTITLLDVDNRQHKVRLDGIDATKPGLASADAVVVLRCSTSYPASGWLL